MPLRLLTLGMSLMVAACATAGPPVANNPCNAPAYRALKARPAESLSEREQKELRQGDTACGQVTAVLASNANGGGGRRPEAPRLDTDAYTQAMQHELGSEIFVRNNGNVAILVTSLTLTACSGVRDFCGTQHPRVRIEPGDVRRVARVRFREAVVGSFQYSYRVEPADPTQN
jgi:hypothetical protein